MYASAVASLVGLSLCISACLRVLCRRSIKIVLLWGSLGTSVMTSNVFFLSFFLRICKPPNESTLLLVSWIDRIFSNNFAVFLFHVKSLQHWVAYYLVITYRRFSIDLLDFYSFLFIFVHFCSFFLIVFFFVFSNRSCRSLFFSLFSLSPSCFLFTLCIFSVPRSTGSQSL